MKFVLLIYLLIAQLCKGGGKLCGKNGPKFRAKSRSYRRGDDVIESYVDKHVDNELRTRIKAYFEEHEHGNFRFMLHQSGEDMLIRRDKDGNGFIYKGKFNDNGFHGHGVLENFDGSRFVGSFVDNNLHGEVEITRDDGKIIKAQYENGKLTSGKLIINSETNEVFLGRFDTKFHPIDGYFYIDDGRFQFKGTKLTNGIRKEVELVNCTVCQELEEGQRRPECPHNVGNRCLLNVAAANKCPFCRRKKLKQTEDVIESYVEKHVDDNDLRTRIKTYCKLYEHGNFRFMLHKNEEDVLIHRNEDGNGFIYKGKFNDNGFHGHGVLETFDGSRFVGIVFHLAEKFKIEFFRFLHGEVHIIRNDGKIINAQYEKGKLTSGKLIINSETNEVFLGRFDTNFAPIDGYFYIDGEYDDCLTVFKGTKLKNGIRNDVDLLICVVCQEVEEGIKIPCSHYLGSKCLHELTAGKNRSNKCPLCRKDIIKDVLELNQIIVHQFE